MNNQYDKAFERYIKLTGTTNRNREYFEEEYTECLYFVNNSLTIDEIKQFLPLLIKLQGVVTDLRDLGNKTVNKRSIAFTKINEKRVKEIVKNLPNHNENNSENIFQNNEQVELFYKLEYDDNPYRSFCDVVDSVEDQLTQSAYYIIAMEERLTNEESIQ